MKGSHIGLVVVLVATFAFGAFGVWWSFLRNPVATPEAALEHYAAALVSERPADLSPCMYIDPVMVTDPEERERMRAEVAKEHIGVRETVVGAAQNRKMSVVETIITGTKGNEAHGEIVMDVQETTGASRRRYIVTLEFQDEGWRVRNVAFTNETQQP